MSKKITLDPSIATLLDISPVGHEERVQILFTASENWTGSFDFVVYNSTAKNAFLQPSGALTVSDNVMTLVIEPAAQGISIAPNYYEISSTSTKRILFKGLLNIVK
jgi:hypothetical protein